MEEVTKAGDEVQSDDLGQEDGSRAKRGQAQRLKEEKGLQQKQIRVGIPVQNQRLFLLRRRLIKFKIQVQISIKGTVSFR